MKQVTFLNHTLNVNMLKYGNGRPAIELVTQDGEPFCVATVNIPCVALEKDEVIIKNYSENVGVLPALIEAGVIENTGKTAQTGFVTCAICKLK